jgi:hypothetical protein
MLGMYIGTMASVPSSVQPLAAGCFIGREMPDDESPFKLRCFSCVSQHGDQVW